jgi:hypothetical protein
MGERIGGGVAVVAIGGAGAPGGVAVVGAGAGDGVGMFTVGVGVSEDMVGACNPDTGGAGPGATNAPK